MAAVIRVRSDETRRRLRWLLTEVERGGVVEILRYQQPVAVMVPPEWYQRAAAALEDEDRQAALERVRARAPATRRSDG